MTTQPRYHLPAGFALALLVIEVVLLAHEHLTGGVRIHHWLHRPDLPAIYNGFGLMVTPVLGGFAQHAWAQLPACEVVFAGSCESIHLRAVHTRSFQRTGSVHFLVFSN